MKAPDSKRFSAALLALRDCNSPADVGPALLRSMQALFDADVYAVNWFGTEKIVDMSNYAGDAGELPVQESLDMLNSHLHQHPLLAMVNATRADGVTRANRWSDVTTLRQFRQTGLYQDYYRLIPSNRQIALGLRIDAKVFVSLTFNREGLDFHMDHGQTLEAFSPHVGYVVGTMLARAKLEEQLALLKIAVSGDTVLVVDEIGAVLFSTDRAEQVLRDYFSGMEEGLPRELRVWLKSNPPTGARLVRKRPGRELVCICGNSMPLPGSALEAILRDSPCPTNVRCVRLTETFENILDWIPFPTPDQIHQVGFTPRESEILFWVIQGKRDPEICKILSQRREVSLRTINNHLRNIIAKTNTETRTGACMEVLDRIKNKLLAAP